jgi:hypothetical protein
MSKHVIAFLDHPFHLRTRSTKFFVDALAREFDVHVFYIESDPRAQMQEIVDAGYDQIVCWQTEYCAPFFLMRGMRVTCIPMYDGVATLPDWYWLPMRQARFINFSEALHARLKRLGIETYHFKYFGIPKLDIPQASFEELRAFFWQRRPEEELSYKFAGRLVGGVATSLHIHNAPDSEPSEDWQPDRTHTVSYFTETGASYLEALARSNVFICPRYTEGIGMAMLEAMARGMCVIAHNEPTATEYIVNGVNGLLVDYRAHIRFERGDKRTRGKYILNTRLAEQIGRKAREFYLEGCREWQDSKAMVLFYVHSTPKPDLSKTDVAMADNYLHACKYALRDVQKFLSILLRLERRGLTGIERSSLSLRDQLKFHVRRVPGARPIWRGLRAITRNVARPVRVLSGRG